MADYIPGSDTEFLAWATNFATYAGAHLAELGIGPPEMIPITTGQTDFDTKMAGNVTAQQSAQSARQAKDAIRDTLESAIRQLRQAAEQLIEAARILGSQEEGMQLRYLSALHEIAGEKTSTLVLPLPLQAFKYLSGGNES